MLCPSSSLAIKLGHQNLHLEASKKRRHVARSLSFGWFDLEFFGNWSPLLLLSRAASRAAAPTTAADLPTSTSREQHSWPAMELTAASWQAGSSRCNVTSTCQSLHHQLVDFYGHMNEQTWLIH